jgi:hypothetical protein
MVSVTLASAWVVFAVWHADAAGVYSHESVEIQPGIHVVIQTCCSSGSMLTECTTQLFLDQTLSNALTTSVSPYSSRGLPGHHQRRGQHLFQLDTVDAYLRRHRRRLGCVHNYRGTNNLAVLPEPVHAFEI